MTEATPASDEVIASLLPMIDNMTHDALPLVGDAFDVRGRARVQVRIAHFVLALVEQERARLRASEQQRDEAAEKLRAETAAREAAEQERDDAVADYERRHRDACDRFLVIVDLLAMIDKMDKPVSAGGGVLPTDKAATTHRARTLLERNSDNAR